IDHFFGHIAPGEIDHFFGHIAPGEIDFTINNNYYLLFKTRIKYTFTNRKLIKIQLYFNTFIPGEKT
ncbi:hypothetical protein, partial [Turicibacter bilis]|uniref:hypothetical protein n=1 Tax=Turicibacter bilis TaxID=2735723 RepID=UPI001BB08520